jgi:hypothetical protein
MASNVNKRFDVINTEEDQKEQELAEEVLKGDRLIFNKIDTKVEKRISKKEAVIFFLFTFFFLFVIFTQLGIDNSFLMNDSIRKSINEWENSLGFEDIQTFTDTYNWYRGYLTQIYSVDHYSNYPK